MTKEKLPIVPEKETVPGIGVAGEVICPIMSIGRVGGHACVRHQCELWMELNFGERKVGRCALAWTPFTMIQLREELERMRNAGQSNIKK